MLKLYYISTFIKLLPRYYNTSRRVSEQNNVATIRVFSSMLLCLAKYGASEENYEQFHFWENDSNYRNSFITWRRNQTISFKFNSQRARELFLDKVIWNKRYAKYVKRDWLYTKDVSKEKILAFLQKHEVVIIKPIDSSCGRGIQKRSSVDLMTDDAMMNILLGGEYIIEEQAINIDEIRQFSPNSLNTIRFVTCINKNKSAQIISTAIRMGNGISHTDNIVTGGIACYIDAKTGIVCTKGLNVEGKYFEEHPTTHIPFVGFHIPMWEECCRTAIQLAEEEPEARFVGWDVVLTTKGIDVLEGNIPPGEELTELNQKGKYQEVMRMY